MHNQAPHPAAAIGTAPHYATPTPLQRREDPPPHHRPHTHTTAPHLHALAAHRVLEADHLVADQQVVVCSSSSGSKSSRRRLRQVVQDNLGQS